MTPRTSRPAGAGPLTSALLTLLLVLAGLLLTAAPGAAHDVLVEAEPGQDAVLDDPAERVMLRYSNEILQVNAAIILSTADGELVADGDPVVEGSTVTLALPEPLASGDYQVQWSVVSADGHRIQGEYAFTVDGAAGATDTGTAPGAAPQSEPAGESTPDGTTIGPVEDEGTDDGAEAGAMSDLPAWLRVLIGVAAAGAVAALVVLLVRRLRDRR